MYALAGVVFACLTGHSPFENSPTPGKSLPPNENRAALGRLSGRGVAGLPREEVGEPVGNTLGDNLLKELLSTMTLVPDHLQAIEPDSE